MVPLGGDHPRRASHHRLIRGAQALHERAAPRRYRRVLAIENEASNLALLHAVIARRPAWRMATARDGAEGLRLAREIRPDLILLDLHLPGMSGEEVLAALRAGAAMCWGAGWGSANRS